MQIATYTYIVLPCVGLFFAVLLALELGRWLSTRRGAETGGIGAIDGAMLGLMGLVIAFTFSGAMTRFDARRNLAVQETNAISTAWLRIGALPEATQPALRERFRAYVDSRLAVYQAMPDREAVHAALGASARIQGEIWALAVAATREPEGQRVTLLVLPALNEMIDVTAERTAARIFHPPAAVFAMLFGVILISALLAGFDIGPNRDRHYVHRLVFALIAAITVWVILDIEYSRLGLIRIDDADRFLVELRASMDKGPTSPPAP